MIPSLPTASGPVWDSDWKTNNEWLDNPCNAISLYRRAVKRIKQELPLDPHSWDNKINDFEFDQWHGQIDLRHHGKFFETNDKYNSVTIFLHHGDDWLTVRLYQGYHEGSYRYRVTVDAASVAILVMAKLYFSDIKL